MQASGGATTCTEHQHAVETKEIKCRLECLQEPVPDLAESDVNSDDDDSPSGSQAFASERDGLVHEEKDMWCDHPAKQLDFEPEINASDEAPVSSPEAAPSNAPEEGGSPTKGHRADGMSPHLRDRYQCSMREKQVPPGFWQVLQLQHVSRK